MKKAEKKETGRILDYIRPNLGSCIYLYIDVMVYGLESEFLDLWYDEDESGLNLIVMKYRNSLQLYSHIDNWDKDGVLEIVKKYDIDAINAKLSMINKLENDLQEQYEKKTGWVFKSKPMTVRDLGSRAKVEMAAPEDAKEIAHLMCSDEQWSKAYNEKKLAEELKERIITGMGRSFIIKDQGKIVAHDATFAETEDIVMASGLIVKPEFVDQMYGAILGMAMDKTFLEEGKEKYFHISDPGRMKVFKKLGHSIIEETGKLMKKRMN